MTTHNLIEEAGQQTLTNQKKPLLRDGEVRTRTGIGKTKRRALILAELFPAPIKLLNEHQLPGRTSYWVASEIDAWLQDQVNAHRARLVKITNDNLNGWLHQAVNEAKGARHA